MLDGNTLALLKQHRNLLAFSAGLDSTALFFLLLREKIPFDIAHVNYHTRAQSDAESERARALAETYGITCHIHDAPPIGSNFESEARRVRYAFFESLIAAHGYGTLLTAHQLDDRLEWLLMQLCKGAGLPELLGMEPMVQRDRYLLIRPLLGTGKSKLRAWLEQEGISWFDDESNASERFRRNRFRNRFAGPMMYEYAEGIERSFRYLDTDRASLVDTVYPVFALDGEALLILPPFERAALIRMIDRWLKERSVLMPGGERERLMQENDVIIARRYAVGISRRCCIVLPFRQRSLPRSFRENCRTLGIAPSVRPYLFENPKAFNALLLHLQAQTPTTR